MLNEEVAKYRELSGDTTPNVPISRIGGYLDGYEKALEQEPYEDVIDRAEAMTEIMMFAGNVKSDEEDIYIKVSDAVQLLRELPPANPQPKTGHWIFDEILDKHYYCSECKSMGVDYWDYCTNCGAKMVEPQESEDKE